MSQKKEAKINRNDLNNQGTVTIVCNILCFVLFLVFFVNYFIVFRLTSVRIALTVLCGCACYYRLLYEGQIHSQVLLYMLLLIFSGLICHVLRTNSVYGINQLICSVSYMGIAFHFATSKHNVRFFTFLYYFVCFFLLTELFILKISPATIMKDGSSWNQITVIGLFFLLILTIVQVQNGRTISLLQGIVFLVLAVLSYGRGGMISAGIFMILCIMDHYEQGSPYTVIAGCIILFILIIGITASPIIIEKLTSTKIFTRFSGMGLETNGRSVIWGKFLNNNTDNLISFLCGSDPVKARYDGNLHNSFLQMYASLGLPFAVYTVSILICSIKDMFQTKINGFIIIEIVLISRAMTEKVFFHGINEIILYIIIFTFLLNRTKRKDERDAEEQTLYNRDKSS